MSDKRKEQPKSNESENSCGEQSYKNQQKKANKWVFMSGLTGLFDSSFKFIIRTALNRKMDNPDTFKQTSTETTRPIRHSSGLLRKEKRGVGKLDMPKESSETAQPSIADNPQNQSLIPSRKRRNTVLDTLEPAPKAKKPRIDRDDCDRESCYRKTEKRINKNDHEENYTQAKFGKETRFPVIKEVQFQINVSEPDLESNAQGIILQSATSLKIEEGQSEENDFNREFYAQQAKAFYESYTYDLTKPLGFSELVYLGSRKKDKITVAVKFVRKNEEKIKYHLCETCLFGLAEMRQKHNENSLYFVINDIYETEGLFIYIMEYQEEYLDLPTYLSKVGPLSWSEYNAYTMFKKIYKATEVLKIAISPEDILVNKITEEIKINQKTEFRSFWQNHQRICEDPKCIFQTCNRKNSEEDIVYSLGLNLALITGFGDLED